MQVAPDSPIHSRIDTVQAKVTEGLEKAFLSEMLKYAGPKPIGGGFGGGIGEEQFSSMLTETYASALAKRIDLGLGERTGAAG